METVATKTQVRPPDDKPPGKGPPDKSQRAIAAADGVPPRRPPAPVRVGKDKIRLSPDHMIADHTYRTHHEGNVIISRKDQEGVIHIGVIQGRKRRKRW